MGVTATLSLLADAIDPLGHLDGRLTRVRHLRLPVRIAIVAVFLLLIALRRRSAPFAGAAALAVLLALSALGVDRLVFWMPSKPRDEVLRELELVTTLVEGTSA